MRKRILEAAAVCLLGILVTAPAFLDRALLTDRESEKTEGGAESALSGGAEDEGHEDVSDGKVLIWTEHVTNGQDSHTITFERISAPYTETGSPAESIGVPESAGVQESAEAPHSAGTWECSGAVKAGELFAEYRLSLLGEDGGLLSEQIISHFPVSFEETYWIRDFSGDGFSDIAFCVFCEIEENDRRVDMRNTFLIWNAELSCFEERRLPLDAPSAWESVGVPLWNEELSAVILFAGDDDVGGNPVLEMYSFLDGEWKKVRRLESIYSEEEHDSSDRPEFTGQRRDMPYLFVKSSVALNFT